MMIFVSCLFISIFALAAATQPGVTTGWVTQTVYGKNDVTCSQTPSVYISFATGLCFLYNGNYTLARANLTLTGTFQSNAVGYWVQKYY